MDIEELKLDLEMCELHAVCHFCRTQLYYYTTKTGWEYMANPDRSPHRKSYVCVHSWAEYKEVPAIVHKEPERACNTPDYIEAPYLE
jgi:hypothetical protein